MRYSEARELVEAALDTLNESALHEATQGAKKLRNMIDHHGNQVQVHAQRYNSSMDPADRAQAMAHMDAHASAIKAYKKETGKEYYGKPLKGKGRTPQYIETTATHRARSISAKGQPGGFNWGVNEMATPKVAKRLKDYKNQSEYMRQKRSHERYPLGHQKKGVSMKSDAVKKLRDLIDHHGTQAVLHGSHYNSTMDANSRAQSYAHHEAKAGAIKAHKALTGKDYFGKKPRKGAEAPAAQDIKTDASHYVRRTGPGGFRW